MVFEDFAPSRRAAWDHAQSHRGATCKAITVGGNPKDYGNQDFHKIKIATISQNYDFMVSKKEPRRCPQRVPLQLNSLGIPTWMRTVFAADSKMQFRRAHLRTWAIQRLSLCVGIPISGCRACGLQFSRVSRASFHFPVRQPATSCHRAAWLGRPPWRPGVPVGHWPRVCNAR